MSKRQINHGCWTDTTYKVVYWLGPAFHNYTYYTYFIKEQYSKNILSF
jgi:hypothetical protein